LKLFVVSGFTRINLDHIVEINDFPDGEMTVVGMANGNDYSIRGREKRIEFWTLLHQDDSGTWIEFSEGNYCDLKDMVSFKETDMQIMLVSSIGEKEAILKTTDNLPGLRKIKDYIERNRCDL